MVLVMGSARYLKQFLDSRPQRRLTKRRRIEYKNLAILRKRLQYLDLILTQASELPLLDTAFLLWCSKQQLDREQSPPTPRDPPLDLADQKVLREVVWQALINVNLERRDAHLGSTFSRVKLAHPHACDQDIEAAIRASVEFERDCLRHYAKLSREDQERREVRKAVSMARQHHHGFLDTTYKQQEMNMLQDLR